ncbi:MAG: tetratricopeptide repeat protein, partial [Xanthomonadales bacterium]|nr:tetratricopeptide repeat protein [Xanthomonadales bacterium]
YASAWGYLGSTFAIQATHGGLPYDEGFRLARSASEEALKIDPNSHLSLSGWIAMMYDRDYELAANYYRRALRLSPNNASVLNNGAILASKIGRTDKAIELLTRAAKADPVSAIPHLNLAQIHMSLGDLDEAQRATGKALELNPNVYAAPSYLALISLLRGDPEQALSRADEIQLEMMRPVVRSIGLYELGQVDESDQVVASFIERHADRYAYYIAMVYAWRGETDTAFEWLNMAIDHNQDIDAIHMEPFLQNLHKDPRWEKTLSRVGLADSQIAHIDF